MCNVFLMRQNELREGIDVEDASGEVVGSSKIAAWKVYRIICFLCQRCEKVKILKTENDDHLLKIGEGGEQTKHLPEATAYFPPFFRKKCHSLPSSASHRHSYLKLCLIRTYSENGEFVPRLGRLGIYV